MSAAGLRVGRYYTAARRHPWVLGKVADWKIPLGPYTPAQIAVAVGGGFLLIKTIGWWSWMGPVPVIGWVLAIWTVRRPKIAGRSPVQAAAGWVLFLCQPRGGRIAGRAARDHAPRPLLGGFTIEDTPAPGLAAQSTLFPAVRRPGAAQDHSPAPRRTPSPAPERKAGPASGVQQLLALARQGGGR
ncbi:hypothetical protein [Streptomyces griseofuscus]|uniref:hypothetical protein n=1 Tax=Streptomyces griseofuscus TaxID=146922 RepID=UPI0036C6DBE7